MSKVLVVDDNAAHRTLLDDALTLAGHTVQTWPSSMGVVARIAQWAPAVVLLDVILPPRNGWAVLADIRQAHLPVRVYMMSAGFPVTAAAAR